MIDLVKALRSRATWETATGITEPSEHIDWMAADEITSLLEENARLRDGHCYEAPACRPRRYSKGREG
jgi:hypothetical protein